MVEEDGHLMLMVIFMRVNISTRVGISDMKLSLINTEAADYSNDKNARRYASQIQ